MGSKVKPLISKKGNLLDSNCKTNQFIEIELLFGVVEALEKGDDSFLSFGIVSLTFVFGLIHNGNLWAYKKINEDYK